MTKGISNFQIEEVFRKLGMKTYVYNNFVGVFPLNYMNNFIDHEMISGKKEKYPFLKAKTQTAQANGVRTGGAYLTFFLRFVWS